MPVWQQACSFVLRLCGSFVLFYACVAVTLYDFSKKKKRNSKKQTKKERKRKKQKKLKRQQACSFSRLQGDKLVFVRCSVCGGKFVVSKFVCGAVRLHACSVHSNALGKSGQQWSLDRLTGRCALYIYKSRKSSKKITLIPLQLLQIFVWA